MNKQMNPNSKIYPIDGIAVQSKGILHALPFYIRHMT